jgi:hypothetical protein
LYKYELWRFHDWKELAELVNRHIPDFDLRLKIYEHVVKIPDYDPKFIDIQLFIENEDVGIGIILDRDLRKSMPIEFSRAVYALEVQKKRYFPVWDVFQNHKELDHFLKQSLTTVADRVRVMQEVVSDADWIYLPITLENWPQFSEAARENLILDDTETDPDLDNAFDLFVKVNQKNISEVSSEFSGERNPESLERYLRARLGSADQIEISLKDILHPFIRKNLNRYEICSGPHCISTGLNVNRGNHPQHRHFDGERMIREVVARYRIVHNTEELKTGDLLLYYNSEEELEHVSTYINHEYAFTKNGMYKFNPYLIQKHAWIEKKYFEDEPFEMQAYRIPKAGERVLLKDIAEGKINSFEPYFKGTLQTKLIVNCNAGLQRKE